MPLPIKLKKAIITQSDEYGLNEIGTNVQVFERFVLFTSDFESRRKIYPLSRILDIEEIR
jgi:hypothetical protein